MLVLSRKPGETICVGDNITVTVLGVHGGVLKLGINAPREVRVLRGELDRNNDWPSNGRGKPAARALASV